MSRVDIEKYRAMVRSSKHSLTRFPGITRRKSALDLHTGTPATASLHDGVHPMEFVPPDAKMVELMKWIEKQKGDLN